MQLSKNISQGTFRENQEIYFFLVDFLSFEEVKANPFFNDTNAFKADQIKKGGHIS